MPTQTMAAVTVECVIAKNGVGSSRALSREVAVLMRELYREHPVLFVEVCCILRFVFCNESLPDFYDAHEPYLLLSFCTRFGSFFIHIKNFHKESLTYIHFWFVLVSTLILAYL